MNLSLNLPSTHRGVGTEPLRLVRCRSVARWSWIPIMLVGLAAGFLLAQVSIWAAVLGTVALVVAAPHIPWPGHRRYDR